MTGHEWLAGGDEIIRRSFPRIPGKSGERSVPPRSAAAEGLEGSLQVRPRASAEGLEGWPQQRGGCLRAGARRRRRKLEVVAWMAGECGEILDARWAEANHVSPRARQRSPMAARAAGAAASSGGALCCSSALPMLVWGQDSIGRKMGAKLQQSGEASVAFIPEEPHGSKLRGQWPVIIFNNTSGETRAEAVALEQHLAPGGCVSYCSTSCFLPASSLTSSTPLRFRFVVSFHEQRQLAMIVGHNNVVSAEEAPNLPREGVRATRVSLSEMNGQVSSSRVVALQEIFDRGLGFDAREHSLL